MSGRNRGPPVPIKSAAHSGHGPVHEPPFGRPMHHHPAMLEEIREPHFGAAPGPLLPHPAVLEEHLAAQNHEIQGLLVDNQRLAATHVALKQELESAQYEIQRMSHVLGSLHPEKDLQLRDAFEKAMKLEADLHATDAMRAELMQVRSDIQQLSAVRQDLTGKVQALTQDMNRVTADLQQVPALKGDIDNMRQELQRARAAIEYEKKGYAENYEHGQAMERNLISMARELEKLRAELANAEKRRAMAAVGNQGICSSKVQTVKNLELII